MRRFVSSEKFLFLGGMTILLAFVIGAVYLGSIPGSQPTDDQLIETFYSHQQDFEKLAEMSLVDVNMVRIASDFTITSDDKNNIDQPSRLFEETRWNQYRLLFQTLSIKNGLYRKPHSGSVQFIVSSSGLVTGGSSKGFIYSDQPLEPLVESLDAEKKNAAPRRIIYRAVQGKWYLFSEVT